LGMGIAAAGRVDDALGDTLPLPQVDEAQSAKVPAPEGPAHQGDVPTDVRRAQGAAAMGSLPFAQGFRGHRVPRALVAGRLSAESSSAKRASDTRRCSPDSIS